MFDNSPELSAKVTIFRRSANSGPASGRQNPSNESRTQVAVNNDGKTNEATKNLREPLQKGQTNPKDARQQQQQEKPQKKTGKGMKM